MQIGLLTRSHYDPRYDDTLRLDALPSGVAVNGPPMEAGADLAGAHVDDYTRHGCANNRIQFHG
jgi:hypothetical protein